MKNNFNLLIAMMLLAFFSDFANALGGQETEDSEENRIIVLRDGAFKNSFIKIQDCPNGDKNVFARFHDGRSEPLVDSFEFTLPSNHLPLDEGYSEIFFGVGENNAKIEVSYVGNQLKIASSYRKKCTGKKKKRHKNHQYDLQVTMTTDSKLCDPGTPRFGYSVSATYE